MLDDDFLDDQPKKMSIAAWLTITKDIEVFFCALFLRICPAKWGSWLRETPSLHKYHRKTLANSLHHPEINSFKVLFYLLLFLSLRVIPYGLAVRIPGFHPGGPGSTPGMGTYFLSVQTLQMLCLDFIKHRDLRSWIYQSEIFFFYQLYYGDSLTLFSTIYVVRFGSPFHPPSNI